MRRVKGPRASDRTVNAVQAEVDSGPGCGGVGHDDDCLCDVVIGTPVPIRFGLTDIAYVTLAARFLGLGRPWRARDLADVMTPVLQVYDQTHEHLWDAPPNEPTKPVREIREALLQHHKAGGTMANAMEEFGLTFEEWRATVLDGEQSRMALLRQEDWEEIETAYRSGCVTSTSALCDKYGMSRPTFRLATTALGWKSPAAEGFVRYSPEFLARMRSLIGEGISCTMVSKMLNDEFGTSCDRRRVSYYRNQMTKRGEL